MFESKSGVLLIGGLGFFVFAFLSNALVPIFMYRNLPEQTVERAGRNQNLMYRVRRPERTAIPSSSRNTSANRHSETAAEALRLGREIYVGEGCWHCHSQFVRPVSNESRRWGPVSRNRGISERTAAARDVRHAPRRARSEPRRRPPLERLARRPLLPADARLDRLADARVSLVLRRRARQAQPARAGADHLRPVARLVAESLPVLRGLQIDRSTRTSDAGGGCGKVSCFTHRRNTAI